MYGKAIDVYKGSIFIAGWFYHTVTSSTLKFYRPEGTAVLATRRNILVISVWYGGRARG